MRTILLVGVDHAYEFLPEPANPGEERVEEFAYARERFAEWLRKKVLEERVTRAFEEAGSGYAVPEGIRKRIRQPTVLQYVCQRISHTFVDATSEELRAVAPSRGRGFDDWDEERRARNLLREERIAAKVVDALGRDEIAILVVGREHLYGVRRHLEAARANVVLHDTTREPWAQTVVEDEEMRAPFAHIEEAD